MGATKASAMRTPAQLEQDRLLMNNWNKMTIAQLAELLGCHDATVRRRARMLREIGVDLPERARTNKAPATVTATVKEAAPEPVAKAPILGGQWSDNWKINPPSLARLMGGR